MKKFLGTFLIAMLISSNAWATDVMVVAANLGSQVGKAAHCGFDTDEFATLSGKTIDSLTAYGDPQRGAALKQFIIAGEMSAKSGPVGESCSEFSKGFYESLDILREANQNK